MYIVAANQYNVDEQLTAVMARHGQHKIGDQFPARATLPSWHWREDVILQTLRHCRLRLHGHYGAIDRIGGQWT